MPDLEQHWWQRDESSVHEGVLSTVHAILNNQKYREHNFARSLKLYGNADIYGLHGRDYARVKKASKEKRLALNVVKSMADTTTAKMGTKKPRAQFLTEGGDWSLQQKARKLTQWWREICSQDQSKAPPAFREIHPHVRSFDGNVFHFKGGDPDGTRERLAYLLDVYGVPSSGVRVEPA